MNKVLLVISALSLLLNLYITTEYSTLLDLKSKDDKEYQDLQTKYDNLENEYSSSKLKIEQFKTELNDNLDKLSLQNKATVLKKIPMGSPINKTVITSSYGKRKHPILKKYRFHKGIDLRADMNTKVSVTADGIVSSIKYDPKGFGKLVEVSHDFGFKTYYGHLNRVLVRVGDVVKKGNTLALSGNTGLSTAPHLHYEIRFGNTPLNPKYYIAMNQYNYENLKDNIYVDIDKLIKLSKKNNYDEYFKEVMSGL
jgi:murein DD-endopeptidase MepM/ murein hydrolase activator NlpD